jgi:hypothetical protein
MMKQKSELRKGTGRSRGGPARRMGEMLPEIGGTAFKRFGFVQSSVVSRWREIVGERYAKVSAPESIRFPQGKREGGTLNVLVSGAHAPMMQHVIPAILERVNRFFGYEAVAKVTIRHGEVSKPDPAPIRLVPASVPVELGDSLRTVADPELRAVLESLAQSVAASTEIKILGKVK